MPTTRPANRIVRKYVCQPPILLRVAWIALVCSAWGATANPSAVAQSDDGATPWAAPPIEQAIAIRDGRTGQSRSWDQMLDDLAQADVVFLGETHLDETTHRLERAVLQAMIQRRDGKVVLSMEMFERDVQPTLDAYLNGEIDEPTFLSRARPWGNYRSAYRPLIETAKQASIPVVAANFPAPLRRRIAMEGKQILENLPADQKNWVPEHLNPNTPEYWKRVDNAIRGHLAMMRGGGDDPQRLFSTQSLWDNAMGEACAKALDDHPDHSVVHVNGGFHTMYWDGTARQFQLRKPDAKVKTISIVPTANPSIDEVRGKPVADYVVFASAIAADVNEGKYTVTTSLDQKYRLSVPKGLSPEDRVPLLIWLGDDGLNSDDGLAVWKQLLGDEVIIAVPDPRYREQAPDLGVGGRWFWPDSFNEDIGSSATAVERMWGYLLRHFPVDPSRVCIAGEGTGATVAAAIALRTDRMPVHGVAWNPRQFTKLKDFPLPLPEYWGDDPAPERTVVVYGPERSQSFWQDELAAYQPSRARAQFKTIDNDPWNARSEWINAIRTGLSLDALPPSDGPRRYLRIPVESARARHWARLQTLWADAQNAVAVDETPEGGQAQPLAVDVTARRFSAPNALPLCPGPFGGTTVVVLPEDMAESEQQAWFALEQNDPIAQTHRFHRLRVATESGERNLATVLDTLRAKNRKNVLIIPARFCADANEMSRLKRQARPFEDSMTLQWLPGLGGQR